MTMKICPSIWRQGNLIFEMAVSIVDSFDLYLILDFCCFILGLRSNISWSKSHVDAKMALQDLILQKSFHFIFFSFPLLFVSVILCVVGPS